MDTSNEEIENEDTEEQGENRFDYLKPWQFKPGQSGNPNGRPKGAVSLKEYAKKMLYEMNEDERMEFMKGLDKKIIWEMAEGKAEAKTDITSGGEPLPLLVKFIDGNERKDS
jgi:hypothetical protein